MSTFELRPSPGVESALVFKKSQASRSSKKSSLRRFSCPCGCGRTGWFSQPRSLRAAPIPMTSPTRTD